MEVLQRVTGHWTAEVVMKHYFLPGRKGFRDAIFEAMPKILADGGQKSPKDELRAILRGATAKTWKRVRARLP